MSDSTNANIKILFVLTLVHFTGDFYSSFISPLYPLFVKKMGLSMAQIGVISGTILLFSSKIKMGIAKLRRNMRKENEEVEEAENAEVKSE